MCQPASLLKFWQVSSYGRVKNRRGQVSAGTARPDGYFQVSIRTKRKQLSFTVHRLVCRFFLGLPPTQAHTHINHKNGNKSDNRVRNLEYATPSQNALHSYALDESNGAPTRGGKPVICRRLGSNDWTRYASMKEVSNETGLSLFTIRRCCRSEHLTAEGYQFKFATPGSFSIFVGELWRDALDPSTGRSIEGWQVSSLGRCNSTLGQLNWGCLYAHGYRLTRLKIGGVAKSVLVHRLVARAFLGPPPSADHAYVNHKDLNKTNNAVENLEYATACGNMQHFYSSVKGVTCRSESARSQSKSVRARLRGTCDWATFPSMAAAAKCLDVFTGGISACCRGKQAQHKDYEFEFAPATVPDVLPGEEWRDVEFD